MDYNKVFDTVARACNEQKYELRNARPNCNSLFLAAYDKLGNKKGGTTFATLYTGGVLSCTYKEYLALYKEHYTKDVCNGAVLAMTEICPNAIGIRCYFELDYRSWVRLPTDEEMISHVKIAHILVKESFPKADVACHIASCTPKIKFSNGKNNEKAKLAMGLHIIFSRVIVNTSILRQLMLTLDARITAVDPFFSGSVDAASAHRESASLRPIYAYKLDECPGCFPIRQKINQPNPTTTTMKKTSNNNKKPIVVTKYLSNEMDWSGLELLSLEEGNNYDSDDDNENVELPELDGLKCEKEGCIKGRRIASPSIYKPWFILTCDDPEPIYFEECDKVNWICDMSIIPPENFMQQFSEYRKPIDAIEVENVNFKNGNPLIFKNEKTLFHPKSKTSLQLSCQSHTDLFEAVRDVIHQFDLDHYHDVQIANIIFTKQSSSMLVSLKFSQETKFCLLKDDYHRSNRIWFFLKLKSKKKAKSEIRFYCHKAECKDILREYQKTKKNTKNKGFQQIVIPSDVKMNDTQKMTIHKTCKPIPVVLRRKIMQILNIKTAADEFDESKISQSFNSNTNSLRCLQSDGSSLPVEFIFDNRIGTMVTKEELSLPIPNRKRDISELNSHYMYTLTPSPKKKPTVAENNKRLSNVEIKATLDCCLDDWGVSFD